MDGEIGMSKKELSRLELVQAVVDSRLTQREAAGRLKLSVRQVKRLCRSYREDGAASLVSKRRGRPSNHRIGEAERAGVIELIKARYEGFGPTLVAEYLRAEDGYRHCVETLRGWMKEAGLWSAKRKGRRAVHGLRERRARFGELVQIDGSPHNWFEGRGPRCTLIAFIDDATGKVVYARFVPVESSLAYLDALHAYVLEHGRPVALYSDRHGIFTKHDPEDPAPTQFERAIEQLGIEGILANSPQAKGRIERLFETLQDRWVKAMRLAGISDRDAANRWLPAAIARHNARFAVAPRHAEDAHVAVDQSPAALQRICSLQFVRTLSKALSCQFAGRVYQIQTGGEPRYGLQGKKITVCQVSDGTLTLLNGEEVLPYRVFDRHAQLAESRIADDKTLNAQVDLALTRVRLPKYRPPPEHPWKRASIKPQLVSRAARSGSP
jgi:transposase